MVWVTLKTPLGMTRVEEARVTVTEPVEREREREGVCADTRASRKKRMRRGDISTTEHTMARLLHILWVSATDVFGHIRISQGKCLLGTLIVRRIRNIFPASSPSSTTDTTRPRPPNRPTRPAMCT